MDLQKRDQIEINWGRTENYENFIDILKYKIDWNTL